MSQSAKKQRPRPEPEPVRVLGRGLRAARGVRLTLKTLREASGKTQIDVARRSQIDQGDVSRLESRGDFDDCLVATLRRYVEALGGTLDLVAQFGDKKISVAGAQASVVQTPANKALQRTGRKPARR